MKAVSISAGSGIACAVLSDGTARCWGDNYFGAAGNGQSYYGNQNPEAVPTPTTVIGLTGAKSVSVGYANSCAIVAGGKAECWGDNQSGELGNGTVGNSNLFLSPNAVPNLSNPTFIGSGGSGNYGFSTCALVAGGSVYCWGANGEDQLGIPGQASGLNPYVPSQATVTNASALAVGSVFACTVVSGGVVECWGGNGIGELGNGSTSGAPAPSPTQVTGLGSAIGVSAGTLHACALLAGGSVRCWGNNLSGQLGESTSTSYEWSPAPAVSGLGTATAISAGDGHTCALISNGSVQCGGDNYWGELGNGTTSNTWTPVTAVGLQNVVAVSAGSSMTCALNSSGAVYCWGINMYGQMGNGTTSQTPQTTPALVKW